MSASNSEGMYERAKDQWLCAVVYMSRQLICKKRRADRINGIRDVADLMLLHANRAIFFESGNLVAFPSLPRLAFMARLNEKTIRRAIADLIALGLVVPERRFEENNRYHLTIPAAAEQHARTCLDLLTNPRNRVDMSCRVVRTEDEGMEFYKVAFEFDRPAPNFWPVVFPPADWCVPAPK